MATAEYLEFHKMSAHSAADWPKPEHTFVCPGKPISDSPDNPRSPRAPSGAAGEEPGTEPFGDLKRAPHDVLERAQRAGRLKCCKCRGSRMFYCYTCFSLVGVNPEEIPQIKLPLKVDIIKHPNETDGKSTAVHAKLLAPDDVTVYTYPCIPEYEDNKHQVALVFPGPGSVTIEEMMGQLSKLVVKKSRYPLEHNRSSEQPPQKRLKGEGNSEDGESSASTPTEPEETSTLKRVVFIDSTWNQTNKIITDERLQALLQVELKTRKTCFWRHQKGTPDTYLSTIEAIYYFMKDYHVQCLSQQYQGQYDNLLFFFSFLYKLISKAKHSSGKL
ncbi:tRNA-uridine aminocarboxypropyltransferase 1 isoform X2 [Lepisosteus oculatus]|uniref:tRNA-uridine aminocarboxypropyltransferase 1 isoform X2 n=1 Tax=Lepisosteus oculatus TaxID=7918 RepID=UPI003723198A